MARLDGVALGAIGAGALSAYAGWKGISIPHALQAVVQGKDLAKVTPTQQIAGSGASAGGSGATGGPATAVSRSQTDWAKAILSGVGGPATQANLMSLYAWSGREASWNSSPPDGAEYTKNPLNVTTGTKGDIGNVNSVGVDIFDTWADGDAATVAEILTFPNITAALRGGAGLCGNPAIASEMLAWSGGGYSGVC